MTKFQEKLLVQNQKRFAENGPELRSDVTKTF